MRVLRLGLGIFIVVQGVLSGEWVFVALGVFFSLMPLLNIGCAGGSCGNPVRREVNDAKEISYEEVR